MPVSRDTPYKWLLRVKTAQCVFTSIYHNPDYDTDSTLKSSGKFPMIVGSVVYLGGPTRIEMADAWGMAAEREQVCTTGLTGTTSNGAPLGSDPGYNTGVNGTYDQRVILAQYDTSFKLVEGDVSDQVSCGMSFVQDAGGNFYGGPSFGVYYIPYDVYGLAIGSAQLAGWIEAGTVSFDGYSFPFYAGVFGGGGPPTPGNTFGGTVVVTPVEFWTYGGVYDASTGEPT